ncbi:MAG: acyltransferase, partial [Gammaproteobacteria bacterium]|nr:acyltransferase [Gammaproteobacteria bacterium]
MNLQYRPEIDGLRTIAVLSVIIYHAEFAFDSSILLKGGFFGVDVFFVISGFLITSTIMKEYEKTRRVSIVDFYERRARRILPALLTVMLASLPFAWEYLLPTQLIDFSKSIIASLLFGSNFYWDITLQEYRAESSLIKPFLHTWSLAVEEQYYIIFPLILLAIYRWWKSHTVVLLTAGFLLSLQFSELMSAKDLSFSFYMLPSRFWELLAGSLLANILYFHPQKENDALLNKTMPVIGMFLVLYSIIFIDLESNHPGYITLVPVIGSMLIIWFANEKELVTKILSSRTFVGIGLISYSLYLWHYPIFAFGRIKDSTPSMDDKIVWIAATFILSIATYFLVEKPFRNKKRISRKHLLVIIISLTGFVGGLSYYWIVNEGFIERLSYLKSVIQQPQRVWVSKDGLRCHSGGGGRQPPIEVHDSCVFIHNPTGKFIISLGDSHAGSLSEKLRLLAKENELNFIQISNIACPHILEYGSKHCRKRATQVVDFLEQYPNSTIVYSARIPQFMEQSRFDNKEGDKEAKYKPVNENIVALDYKRRSRMLEKTLNSWIDSGHKLVLIYPVPEQGFHVKRKLFIQRPVINNEDMLPDLSTSYSVFKKRVKSSYEALNRINGDQVQRVYPEKVFCDELSGRCFASKGKQIFFGSDNHVSPLGSRLIVNEIAKQINLNSLSEG